MTALGIGISPPAETTETDGTPKRVIVADAAGDRSGATEGHLPDAPRGSPGWPPAHLPAQIIDGGGIEPGDLYEPADVEAVQYPATDNAPRHEPPNPVPWIGSVPLAGVVKDSGTVSGTVAAPATKLVTVGTSGEARPDVIGMALLVTAGAGTVEVLPNGSPDSLGAGFLLPAAGVNTQALFLPIKRANLRLTGIVTVTYLVIASDLSNA